MIGLAHDVGFVFSEVRILIIVMVIIIVVILIIIIIMVTLIISFITNLERLLPLSPLLKVDTKVP